MTELVLVKAKLGITSDSRDQYLSTLIGSVQSEMENVYGIKLNTTQKARLDVIDLVTDLVAFRYRRDPALNYQYQLNAPGYPPNLRLRLHNLYVKYAGLPKEPEDV